MIRQRIEIKWARWESNPHGLTRRILSPLRLPFRHSPKCTSRGRLLPQDDS